MFSQLLEANNISRNFSIEKNGLDLAGAIRQDLVPPVCHERFFLAGGERSHLSRFGIQLLLVEDRKISFDHITELDLIVHVPHFNYTQVIVVTALVILRLRQRSRSWSRAATERENPERTGQPDEQTPDPDSAWGEVVV